MNTKKIITSISIGLVVLIGTFFAVFGSSLKNTKSPSDDSATQIPVASSTTNTESPVITSTTSTSSGTKTVPVTVTGYTLADVATHNSATSCWSAINGNVYDLTNWVNSHPGGKAAILMICGKDGSPLFNTQHGGDRKPENILTKYKIAALN